MEFLSVLGKFFSYNYCLICAFVSWIVAQVLKTLFVLIWERRFDAERLFGAGGMPSAHSATVCALTIAVSRECGVGSPMFAISSVLAIVVMYDATGVRRSSGEQAKVINRMVDVLDIPDIKQKEIKSKLNIFSRDLDNFEYIEDDDEEAKKLKEQLGHTPLEVLGGALIGIVIALIVPK